jgi:hypothetical protein
MRARAVGRLTPTPASETTLPPERFWKMAAAAGVTLPASAVITAYPTRRPWARVSWRSTTPSGGSW